MAGGTQNTGSMELARPARRIRDEVRMPHAGSHLRRHFDETFQAEHEASRDPRRSGETFPRPPTGLLSRVELSPPVTRPLAFRLSRNLQQTNNLSLLGGPF